MILFKLIQINMGLGLVSRKSEYTFDIVKDNPNLPWNWNGLCLNPNITSDIVKANPG